MPERTQGGQGAARPTPAPKAGDDTAASIAGKAKKTASDVADKAGTAVEDVAALVTEKAQDVTDDALATVTAKATDVAERGKGWTKDVVRSIGRAIDAGGESFERDGMRGTAGYVRAAANGLMQAADSVGEVNTTRLTSRAENFVRERPMMSIAALALVGFAVASILRSDRD